MRGWQMCLDSLDGPSVGDAVGAQFSVPGVTTEILRGAQASGRPWPWTDDTEMACALVEVLAGYTHLNQDALATAVAERFDPYCNYGGGAAVILRQIHDGAP